VSRATARLAGGAHTNLPAELTPFLNREKELSALAPLVHDVRLLSLLGPAGVGKTRLALRLAHSVRRHFADGAWLVQLGPVRNGELLPAVIAGVLGISEALSGETLSVLEATLASRQLLLVLDGCEHLAEQVGTVLDRLLRSCPRLSVIATSRERLGLAGELMWRVPPLEVPDALRRYSLDELLGVDAVALFVDRARRANPGFAVTAANAADVVELVRCLDGLPLAVELAAGWMETLSPGELAGEFARRYQVLAARSRPVSDRETGLWAAIESGYDRLDPSARQLFCQLGVFAGGWNLGAMTTVCSVESAPAVEVLGLLVDRSFVTVVPTSEGPTRYRLLEVLRRFALGRLEESGQRDAVQHRFARHVVEQAERASAALTGREGPRWLAALDADLDNLRAVLGMEEEWAPELKLRLAVAIIPYWHFRGLFNEGRRHLRAVLEGADAESAAVVSALCGLSWLSWAQGDMGSAARHARAAVRAGRRIGDRRGTAYALLRLAQARFDSGRVAGAGAATVRAQRIAGELRDERLTAECILQLGQVALVERRLDDADRLLRQSVRLLAQTGQADREAVALLVLGRLCLQQGRHEEAEASLLKSLRVLREFALVRHSVPILESLAAVATARDDQARAASLFGAASALLRRMGARPPRTAPMRAALIERLQPVLESPVGARAYAEGEQMDLRRAIAFALGDAIPGEPRRPAPVQAATQGLTARQLEVARFIGLGLSNKEIAARLTRSERTVEGHVEQICNKLGFNSRVQIAAWIVRHDAGGQPPE
jgi:predicted ATPase/DNA-binding NarL/FixJ family response regulator